MPAAPKSPPSKKTGTPKTKGTVRAKSGCYTCRIRRKKCDEQINEANQCQNCVRLRLQCLGFGAKRPEWLRESRNVTELREKIKTFLAAQGMIKGHSGSGPRSMEQEPSMLRLTDDDSSSSGSPPTPTLSLVSADEITSRHPVLMTSAIREQSWSFNSTYSGFNSSPGEGRPESPYSSSQDGYEFHYQPSLTTSNSLVCNPAISSSFSQTYNMTFPIEEWWDPTYPTSNAEDGFSLPNPHGLFQEIDELVHHYREHVVEKQYLLADRTIHDMIIHMASSHPFICEAVRLLASVHLERYQRRNNIAIEHIESRERYDKLRSLFRQTLYTADDAMAALHVVSTILFNGGQGMWENWLRVACIYADGVLSNPRYHGPEDALKNCDEKESFVIKTTMWFDVLASVTTQTAPHFLHLYRQLFRPGRSGIDDFSSTSQLSMMSVMGCENHVVWALAETSYLAYWKEQQLKRGRLSIPDLVAKATEIDASLAQQHGPHPPVGDVELCRHFTAEIFRASTRVYVRSVVSGDYPFVPEIAEAVAETIKCLSQVLPQPDNIRRSITRSTFYGIFICGCLTDDTNQRLILLECMNKQNDENVGNCSPIKALMEHVWEVRRRSPKGEVRWREMLKDSKILLV